MNERLDRVAEAIKVEVAQILQRELKDPRIGFVTVTRVKVSPDLQQATVYFSSLSPQAVASPPGSPAGENQGLLAQTEAGLKSAQGFIRRVLGDRLRLRVTPEVIFRTDPSVAENIRISKLLGGLKRQGEGESSE